ncbi:hypothetical protein Barb7_01934 [Bacteroidales bacterium Barb7]|nr:hypothetical protein Barb7_01934 [Bacteroidales bacterium Barb7]
MVTLAMVTLAMVTLAMVTLAMVLLLNLFTFTIVAPILHSLSLMEK